MKTTIAHLTVAAALLVGFGPTAAHAFTQTFDTPTANTATTQATYGMTAVNLFGAVVADGQLRLYPNGGPNGNFTFGTFAGDMTFSFDTTISRNPGYVNVGYSAGSTTLYFHPGYWDAYFVSALGISGQMGFTPDWTQPTHVTVGIAAATNTFSVGFQNGAKSYGFSYVDPNYSPGTSPLGFTVGAINSTYYGAFDNLTVPTAPIPEPSDFWLMTSGLGLLGVVVRRRARLRQRTN